MLEAQQYSCAICGTAFELYDNGKTFRVDHDHETNEVRSLLCQSCNLGIGHFGDSVELMQEAIAYLRFHKQEPK